MVGSALVAATARTPSPRRGQTESSIASPPRGSGSMFASRGFLLVTVAEAGAIGIGNKLLAATGHTDYAIAWVATVVGLHFVALGRLFFAGFVRFGLALVTAGLIGVTVGGAGGGGASIKATTGLLVAACFFGVGVWSLLAQRAPRAAVDLGAPIEVS